jgi:transmembrane sensor
MTDLDLSRRLTPVAREAVHWFARLQDRNATEAQRAEFAEWVAQSPRHRAAYQEIESLWLAAGDVSASRPSRRRFLRYAVAAGVAGLAVAGSLPLLPYGLADHRTDTGERKTIELSDGTRIDLSTATALSVDFTPTRRRVTLLGGAAFFTVAPDSNRPFTVKADNGQTTALGTAFEVAHLGPSVTVTVTESAVAVEAAGRGLRLKAGEAARYDATSLTAIARPADPEVALAWRDGRLVFLATPFGEVIETLDRWRPGMIQVMDRQLADRPVTAIVDVRRPEAMLDAIAGALPIRLVTLSPYLTLIYPA